jgi:ParB-like chromosome segregation protein Spo0J
MQRKPLKSTALPVAISDIDLKPGPFNMSFNFDLEPLKASIDKFGVLNPPYLLKASDSALIVVAGYRRLLAVRESGWPDLVCEILPEDLPPLEALLLNLYDNLAHRHLNAIEKGMILQRLTGFLTKEQVVSDFMSLLGLPSNNTTLELYLDLMNLEETIKISIATERLSLRVTSLMNKISRDDRLTINDLFTTLKWSFNQQWEIIQWLIEIASREGRSIKAILDEQQVKQVLQHGTMNKPQKVKTIVRILKARRFPSLLKAERSFQEAVSELPLPLGVRIIPPPFFEGVDYRLEVVFTTGQELKDKLAELFDLRGLEKVTAFSQGIEQG